jgi:hypothetical protein
MLNFRVLYAYIYMSIQGMDIFIYKFTLVSLDQNMEAVIAQMENLNRIEYKKVRLY